MLRININGDKVSLRLKRFIDPDRWDAARYQMKGRTEEARIFNDYIDAVKVRAHKKYNELLSVKEEVLASVSPRRTPSCPSRLQTLPLRLRLSLPDFQA